MKPDRNTQRHPKDRPSTPPTQGDTPSKSRKRRWLWQWQWLSLWLALGGGFCLWVFFSDSGRNALVAARNVTARLAAGPNLESREPNSGTASGPSGLFPNYPSAAPYPADSRCVSRLVDDPRHRVKALAAFSKSPENNCGSHDPVEISSLAGTKFASPVVMGCKAATSLAQWLAKDVPELSESLDLSPPTKLYHFGTYNCRRIAGRPTWSQHAFANAIDIAAFDVPQLGRVSLARDYDARLASRFGERDDSDGADDGAGDGAVDGAGDGAIQSNQADAVTKAKLLKAMRDSLCRQFNVVLGPEYNSAHADHFHVDLGPYRHCR